MAEMILPFKPFTLEQSQEMADVSAAVLDRWVKANLLPLRRGDDGLSTGLDYNQVFAAFVGGRYLHEGSGYKRADGVVRFLAAVTVLYLEEEFDRGHTFAVGQDTMRKAGSSYSGMLVKAPGGPLGNRLDCRRLLAEFRERVAKVFPNG